MLFTPVLYIATLSGLQTYFQGQYLQRIENIFIGDTASLLDGRKSVEEQINENIYTLIHSQQTYYSSVTTLFGLNKVKLKVSGLNK